MLTSRNIRGGPLVDFLLGGLNYQLAVVAAELVPGRASPSTGKPAARLALLT